MRGFECLKLVLLNDSGCRSILQFHLSAISFEFKLTIKILRKLKENASCNCLIKYVAIFQKKKKKRKKKTMRYTSKPLSQALAGALPRVRFQKESDRGSASAYVVERTAVLTLG